MTISRTNPLLATDVYKMGHMEQYCPGTTKVYSYLCARSDKNFDRTVFFGLQYYIREYLTVPLTPEMGEEFLAYRQKILGTPASQDVIDKITALCRLGYFPLEIKAVPEGTIVPVKNALMTIQSTMPEFYWAVGFVESMILKIWYPITVATQCHYYREFVDEMFRKTCSPELDFLKLFMVHDFGYRGDASEEGAAISGAAHLLSFAGSDTVPAYKFIDTYYPNNEPSALPTMCSVPASEHSCACSFGQEDELASFRHMLNTYPTGIVSIISDTYDVYQVLTTFAEALKEQILARDGKTVFRPDSGNPEYIICGDPNAPEGSNEYLGGIRLLDRMFGSTLNSKGFKELNPKVGLIYGDGMYLERYKRTMYRLADMGYAASNLVIGVGGILRNHSRDTLGFALKATYVEIQGEPREIEKNPVTDTKKKSHKGLMTLQRFPAEKRQDGWVTFDHATAQEEQGGELICVYRDGVWSKPEEFRNVRARALQPWGADHA